MRNKESYTPARTTTVTGGRRCVECKQSDLHCQCSNEQHSMEATRLLGRRMQQEDSDEQA